MPVVIVLVQILSVLSVLSSGIHAASSFDDFLIPHNQERSQVSGLGVLKWSKDLERNASGLVAEQKNKNACGFADLRGYRFGANQAAANFKLTPGQVVASWIEEKIWYSHANNSCMEGHQCGTYTQVVWNTTEELGCSQSVCSGKNSLTICLYNPPGNVVGQAPY